MLEFQSIMSATLYRIHPDNPEGRKISQIVELLNQGGLVLFPTDSVYAVGASLYNRNAIREISKVRNLTSTKHDFSLICRDMHQVSEFTLPFSRPVFKLMNRCLPGPYTFILHANKQVERLFGTKKHEIGLRVPDHPISQALVAELSHPLIVSSLHNPDDPIQEYFTNPEELWDEFQHKVDAIIDGGPGSLEPSTVIDCTVEEPLLVREGKGSVEGI